MTVVAITILTVWALGIVVLAAVFPSVARQQPEIEMGFVVDPVRAALLAAVVTVFWPAALLAVALVHLIGRGQR